MSSIESENPYIEPLSAHIITGVEMDPNYPPHDGFGLNAAIHALVFIHKLGLGVEQDVRFQVALREATDLMGIAMKRESPNLGIYL